MTLKDAIDRDFFIIDNTQFFDSDLRGMSTDDLETLKMRITKKISGLSASLKEKQIDYFNGGEGATKDWYMRRKLALSINQRVLTYVSYLIKKRKGMERPISEFFMDSAKDILPKQDYDLVLSNAQKTMESMERQ